MVSTLDNASFAMNNKPLGNLNMALKQNSPEGIKTVAKQFEAMFLNIMLRGMRSSGGNSLLDNNETKLYTEQLDQQFAQKIAEGRGIGLADALVKQLTRNQSYAPPSLGTPAQLMPLKKTEEAKAFPLPGTAATALPLRRNEPPATLTMPFRPPANGPKESAASAP